MASAVGEEIFLVGFEWTGQSPHIVVELVLDAILGSNVSECLLAWEMGDYSWPRRA